MKVTAALLRRVRPGGADEDARMTLSEHLAELRHRLLVSLLAVVVGTAVAFAFHRQLLSFLTGPYCSLPASRQLNHGHCALIVTGVLDAFTVTFEVSLYAGLLAASPVWLWQVWRFVTPGLYRHERRWALSFVGASLLLFAGGTALGWITLHKGLRVLLSFASGGITPLLAVNRYLSFAVALVLVYAVSFEFPLVVVMLNMVGVVSYKRLRRLRRTEIVCVFLFAAVACPSTDPFTMTALAVCMCLLYEIALIIARVHDRRAARRAAASPYAGLSDDETSPLQMGTA